MESIIAAVIAGILAAGASIYAARAANDRLVAVLTERLDNHKAQTTHELARLEAKQDRHNGLIERMVKQEMENEAQWRRIDQLAEEIHDIKIGGTE